MRFGRKKQPVQPVTSVVQTASQGQAAGEVPMQLHAYGLFESIRRTIPIIDAALSKLVRLVGSFTVTCSDPRLQGQLEDFLKEVPVGLTGHSIYSFVDSYFDSLLVYGNAVGEIVLDSTGCQIAGLWNGNVTELTVKAGETPLQRQYVLHRNGEELLLPHPERILFTAMKPPVGSPYGVSLLQGLPFFAGILMRIYESVGQNYDRAGNVRYAVTYKPSNDPAELAYAGERARQIAKEWSDGMQAAKHGEIRDFVAVGDVEIKVIGADCQMPDTEIPVRQLLEQILSKLSVPPFLLGLSWSSTERMSAQQADILTSELEYYRRLLEPVICRIAKAYLELCGSGAGVTVEWSPINLQDEEGLALARLHNAQAEELEAASHR